MSKNEPKTPNNTLYILGAGASHALSYMNSKEKFLRRITPLDADFISRMKEHFDKKAKWRGQTLDLIIRNWMTYGDFEKNGLEKAILTRISQYEFRTNFELNRNAPRRKIANDKYLYYLSCLICEYLQKCKISPSRGENMAKTFIDRVFPQGEEAACGNRIITFNYDSLLDNLLIKRGVSLQDLYFSSILKERPSSSESSTSKEVGDPLMLKLHGSANWRCEYKLFREIISEERSGENMPIWHNKSSVVPVNLSKPGAEIDEKEPSPLIIPPIPDKRITEIGIFKSLWERARGYMLEAKHIVIVGYSCPPTDVFARAMFTNFAARESNLDCITIVDPNAAIMKDYRDMINTKPRVKWNHVSDFSDYIDHSL